MLHYHIMRYKLEIYYLSNRSILFIDYIFGWTIIPGLMRVIYIFSHYFVFYIFSHYLVLVFIFCSLKQISFSRSISRSILLIDYIFDWTIIPNLMRVIYTFSHYFVLVFYLLFVKGNIFFP